MIKERTRMRPSYDMPTEDAKVPPFLPDEIADLNRQLFVVHCTITLAPVRKRD